MATTMSDYVSGKAKELQIISLSESTFITTYIRMCMLMCMYVCSTRLQTMICQDGCYTNKLTIFSRHTMTAQQNTLFGVSCPPTVVRRSFIPSTMFCAEKTIIQSKNADYVRMS
jgi:hypothetical protein